MEAGETVPPIMIQCLAKVISWGENHEGFILNT